MEARQRSIQRNSMVGGCPELWIWIWMELMALALPPKIDGTPVLFVCMVFLCRHELSSVRHQDLRQLRIPRGVWRDFGTMSWRARSPSSGYWILRHN